MELLTFVAIHPEDEHAWYLAVGSGNVWKKTNARATWETIFDEQGSHSTTRVPRG